MNRYKDTKIASILGIIGNIFLLIIKGTIGFITNSQSMIADSFNSFGDVFSSLMTYIGNKISSKKADDDHNLGHGKAEYIYSMLISIAMILMGLFVFKDAFHSIFNHSKYEFSIWLIIVCIVTILTPSTITRFSLVNTFLIEPSLPLLEPAITITLSPTLRFIFSPL